jgi:hypothetical protein
LGGVFGGVFGGDLPAVAPPVTGTFAIVAVEKEVEASTSTDEEALLDNVSWAGSCCGSPRVCVGQEVETPRSTDEEVLLGDVT